MFTSFFKKYPDYIIAAKPDLSTINKYKNLLPGELIDFWQQYGFGSFMNGYLKIVDPQQYQPLLNKGYHNPTNEIVFAITGLADFIVWTGKAIRLIDFRHGSYKIIETGDDMTWFFDDDLADDGYAKANLKNENYSTAVKRLGLPDFDECFGYQPVLAAGGSEKAENLEKVKLAEHIDIILQFTGAIQ